MEQVEQQPGSTTEYLVDTAWGAALLTVRGDELIALRPPGGRDLLGTAASGAPVATAPAGIRAFATSLVAYFDGAQEPIASRDQVERWLEAAGVVGFRRDLSLALFDVPRGVTISYGELAALAGRPGAARAAGTTCARNPLPVIIPCHRVVHAGARRGDVGAYGAATGSEYKRRLLELEDAALVRGAVPGNAPRH
ncbi:MAG: Methylated-DNA--protein-cysteine methyltransferase [Thermoleophilia bacterium]|jgi:methylated-DNA-[protein]-cysteine S-methyltransferase|nr:Methylated-DNA--protein-cysteine methyltransferase [Thermoleophilia bacterium]